MGNLKQKAQVTDGYSIS